MMVGACMARISTTVLAWRSFTVTATTLSPDVVLLGSDEPLHGGQRSGHNGKLIRRAKSQIRICVLGACA
jgi:hypothetical protein